MGLKEMEEKFHPEHYRLINLTNLEVTMRNFQTC